MTFRAPDRTLTADEVSEFRLAAAARKTTITCMRGKLAKTVTAVKPACPGGYKKK
jgi:hypothetical protein